MQDAVLFHVLQGSEHSVILRMTLAGAYTPYAPGKRSVQQMWPRYAEARPYLETWLAARAGAPCDNVLPGAPEYPRRLAAALTRTPELAFWAYVTPLALLVGLRQIAMALGRANGGLRAELEARGLTFTQNAAGHYLAPLGSITRVLGQDVADRVLLYPRQVGDFLGVQSGSAAQIVRRLGLALEKRADTTMTPWGKVRQVRRIGPRRFVLADEEVSA